MAFSVDGSFFIYIYIYIFFFATDVSVYVKLNAYGI